MRNATGSEALLWEDARSAVIESVGSLPKPEAAETVSLTSCLGRVLQQPVLADRDYPTLRRSLRDGYAIRSSEVPGRLLVRGEIRAGECSCSTLDRGEALEIMTGAPVPAGADAVVMVEHTSKQGGFVLIDRKAEPGQFVNAKGAEALAGTILVPAGTKIDSSHIAAFAMTGKAEISVRCRPTVAILATGDEIVGVQEVPEAHQIRNSNACMLAALVQWSGGNPRILQTARDNSEDLLQRLKDGLQMDMLVITGGVSAGKYDLVKPTLRKLGVEFLFERVRIQPGQPTAFGILDGKPVFGLPGNPGSSLITYQLFARAALEVLAGEAEPVLPLLLAHFEAPFRHKPGLTRFLPARLSSDGQSLRHLPWQGSSDVPALARANAYLVASQDRESWNAGDSIPVLSKA